jgi:predicted nucleic-acid-binding Zn-ribbon protein
MSKEGIVFPIDFGFDGEDYFSCPKCSSSVVMLDEEMVQQNTITALKEREKQNYVLKCKNCGFKDLLRKFFEPRILDREEDLMRLRKHLEELDRRRGTL